MRMIRNITPLPLRSQKEAFDHPDWIFELKYDGFRALAVIENGRCRLLSRNGHRFASFSELEKHIEISVPGNAVLDGEIVCVDRKGRPRFNDLLFRRGNPCFFSFDLLSTDIDFRSATLMDRKQDLRRLLARVPSHIPLRYADHVEGKGVAPV
jgi:bifunctional non-homologous end joining protein LigD